MHYFILVTVVSVSLWMTVRGAGSGYYTAAAIEYHSYWNNSLTADDNAAVNAGNYADYIRICSTKYSADIVVFPESGLLNYDDTLFFEVPNPEDKVIPADSENLHWVLRKISGAARSHKVYVVINLHEKYNDKGKIYKYNTNIVFDRNGTIIARYRKYNLFGEAFLNKPNLPEYVYFDTDFGVRFGTFTCFDILFDEPALGLVRKYNITNIVYPTAWFSELPFLTALQGESSWAYGNNVNLIAANHNDVRASSGSGIYRGVKGNVGTINTIKDGTSIIIGKLPKERGTTAIFEDEVFTPFISPISNNMSMLKEPLDDYETRLISTETPQLIEKLIVKDEKQFPIGIKQSFHLKTSLCHNKLCCSFDLKYCTAYYNGNYTKTGSLKLDSLNQFDYRLAVIDGSRIYPVDGTAGLQVCGLISCLNEQLGSCGEFFRPNKDSFKTFFDEDIGDVKFREIMFDSINISGNFSTAHTLIQPNILETSDGDGFGQILNPNQYKFTLSPSDLYANVTLVFKSKKLITGAIYSRVYDRDTPESNSGKLPTNQRHL